jgi:hypothetical protein
MILQPWDTGYHQQATGGSHSPSPSRRGQGEDLTEPGKARTVFDHHTLT